MFYILAVNPVVPRSLLPMMPPMKILTASFLACPLLLALPQDPLPETAQSTAQAEPEVAARNLEAAFAEQGIVVDLDLQLCALPVEVCVCKELLEYVLVTQHGASHESLLATQVAPTLLNAALVTLGAKKGTNVRWKEKDPRPTEEERRNGAATHDVEPPTGVTFFMYVAWRVGEETYFFRLEDLITNLDRGRSMQRHGWVYLGSRMVQPKPSDPTRVLAAELEGNLINLSFFRAGNTLFTACLDACVYQTIWAPNAALIPPTGTKLTMVLSRKRLSHLPPNLQQGLVEIGPE